MAIYFFTSTSSDLHLLSESAGHIGALGMETHAGYITDFDQFESQIKPQDVIIVRALGGLTFYRDWLEKIRRMARERKIPFACLPGFKDDDLSIISMSTVPGQVCNQLLSFYEAFHSKNIVESVKYLSDLYSGTAFGWASPETVPDFGVLPGYENPDVYLKAKQNGQKVIAILFYRSHYLANDYEPVDLLVREVLKSGGCPIPVFCNMMKQSKNVAHPLINILKDKGQTIPHAIIDCLSYAAVEVLTAGNVTRATEDIDSLFSLLDRPVLHALYCSESESEWLANPKGMKPNDMAMKVVLPEFDGKVIGQPVAFVESSIMDGQRTSKYKGNQERIRSLVTLANRFAGLSLKKNQDKKIAIVLTNYPTQNARIGNAVGLDTPQSLVLLLNKLKDAGYTVDNIPKTGDDLIHLLINQSSYDKEFLTDEQIEATQAKATAETYQSWFTAFPDRQRKELLRDWGNPPGNVYVHKNRFYFPGLHLGNVFIGIQPPRGFGENPIAIYHSPDMVPTHHYLAFYRWIKDELKADAVLHMGKHGNLEWLPGKAVALTENCYPDMAISEMPFFYYFIINNPGEGSQAKRRTHAVLVDHMVPPMTRADLYDDLARIEQLIEEWTYIQNVDPDKLSIIQKQIWDLCETNHINQNLGFTQFPENFKSYRQSINGFLCEIGNTQIRGGLHVLGQIPQDGQLIDLFVSLARIDTPPHEGTQSLFMKVCQITETAYFNNQSHPCDCHIPAPLLAFYGKPISSRGDLLKMFDHLSYSIFDHCFRNRSTSVEDMGKAVETVFSCQIPGLPETLAFFLSEIYPKLQRTTEEFTGLLNGLNGLYVRPGPSGAPTRGMASILPTGRNFYSVDIQSIPTTTSWIMGKRLADSLLDRYMRENKRYPESIAMVLWGTSNMRTKGDDIAQILYLLGVKPVWKPENKRVMGVEVIPLEELKRPRIDTCLRISGFFRDAFQNLVCLMDEAIRVVANLDEPLEMNFVRKHCLASQSKEIYRIFGSAPGQYGTGILEAITTKNWDSQRDLADIFLNWGGYAYTKDDYGVEKKEIFKNLLAQTDVATQNQDNREHDIFDSDDYLQFHGGIINAINQIKSAQGKGKVMEYLGDSSNPAAVKISSLKEEVRRVYHARVVNPKWIDAMKHHGYKGGLEMAATVDYMFGYDATTDVIDDYMYEGVTQSYLLDSDTQRFLKEKNPWAVRAMGERLMEAANRGLWKNPDQNLLLEIELLVASVEGDIEDER